MTAALINLNLRTSRIGLKWSQQKKDMDRKKQKFIHDLGIHRRVQEAMGLLG